MKSDAFLNLAAGVPINVSMAQEIFWDGVFRLKVESEDF